MSEHFRNEKSNQVKKTDRKGKLENIQKLNKRHPKKEVKILTY